MPRVRYTVDQCKRSVLSLPRRHPSPKILRSLFPISTLLLSASQPLLFSHSLRKLFGSVIGVTGRGGGSWREKCVRASRAKTPLLLLSPFNPSKELGVRVYRKEKRGGGKREQCRFVLLDREDLLDRSIEGIDTNFARFEIFLRRNVGRRLLKGNKKARDNTVILLLLYPESYRILASRFSVVEPTTIIFAFDPGKCRLSHVSPISRNNHVHTYIRNTDTGEMRMKIRRLRFVGANR